MLRAWLFLHHGLRILVACCLVFGWVACVQAMPAQVIIIRHAEKYEDPRQIHLSPKGRTRALALAEFFQSDPRVLQFGRPAAIIAQSPTPKKLSQRSLETVAPLAQALSLPVISQFTYGQSKEMVQWLTGQRQYDGKTVLISMNHIEIKELAQALGVTDLNPRVWPHETYDRLYILTFAPKDGRLLSLCNLPENLLFGDSFQAVAGPAARNTARVTFKQVYLAPKPATGQKSPAPQWQFSFTGRIKGNFANFTDETIPVLRVGGFCFGYHLTTLGYLKKDPNAVVKINAPRGSGTLTYRYKSKAGGALRTYAWISFAWDRQSLRVEFKADVDEGKVTPEIDLPINLEGGRPEGLIVGSAPCCLAFGPQRFLAPVGLSYQGMGGPAQPPAPPGSYRATLTSVDGFLLAQPMGSEKTEAPVPPGEHHEK